VVLELTFVSEPAASTDTNVNSTTIAGRVSVFSAPAGGDLHHASNIADHVSGALGAFRRLAAIS
jgi:hypothetical protein